MSTNISKLARQIKKNPDDSFSKFALALELLKIGEQKSALPLFKNIAANDPEYVGVYYHLGKLYEELGENNLAFDTYKAGISVAEQNQDHHSKSELQGALINLEIELED